MEQFIIIYGDVVDGHLFVGPFASHDEALRYAEDDGDGFIIVTLQTPATDEED